MLVTLHEAPVWDDGHESADEAQEHMLKPKVM